jgi:hypothetical protein
MITVENIPIDKMTVDEMTVDKMAEHLSVKKTFINTSTFSC